jgi:hypothetical protein
MLKKIVAASLLMATLFSSFDAQAQRRSSGSDYNTGVGIRLDFGSGGTYFGFAGKHFFSEAGAGEAHLLFASGSTLLGLEYQHHFDIPSAAGLKWYLGFGPGFNFVKGGGTSVLLRPVGGLEYKIQSAPINLGFDWRPAIVVSNGSGFEAGRFGLAARYVF